VRCPPAPRTADTNNQFTARKAHYLTFVAACNENHRKRTREESMAWFSICFCYINRHASVTSTHSPLSRRRYGGSGVHLCYERSNRPVLCSYRHCALRGNLCRTGRPSG